MNEEFTSTNSQPISGKWWIPIGALVVIFPMMVVIVLVTPPDALFVIFSAPLALLAFVLTVLSPLFIYFDKQYVKSISEWEPSGRYYWIAFPLVTHIVAIIYVYRRHKYVGIP